MTKYKDQFPGVFFSLMESFLFCLRHSIHPFPHRLETEYIAVSLSSVVVVSLWYEFLFLFRQVYVVSLLPKYDSKGNWIHRFLQQHRNPLLSCICFWTNDVSFFPFKDTHPGGESHARLWIEEGLKSCLEKEEGYYEDCVLLYVCLLLRVFCVYRFYKKMIQFFVDSRHFWILCPKLKKIEFFFYNIFIRKNNQLSLKNASIWRLRYDFQRRTRSYFEQYHRIWSYIQSKIYVWYCT